jgi:hypothetical protein
MTASTNIALAWYEPINPPPGPPNRNDKVASRHTITKAKRPGMIRITPTTSLSFPFICPPEVIEPFTRCNYEQFEVGEEQTEYDPHSSPGVKLLLL